MSKKIYLTTMCAILLTVGAGAVETLTPQGRSSFPKPQPVTESSQWKPHVGLLAGAAIPEGPGKASAELGLDIGFQPFIPFGLGAEYIHTRFDDGIAATDRNTLWLRGTYNFGGDIEILRYSYIGAAIGSVFTNSETAFAAAPLLGFDIPTELSQGDKISLGANAKYAFIGDNQTDALSINGVVKYWY